MKAIYGVLMEFNGDLMGFNGIEWDSMVIQWWFNGI